MLKSNTEELRSSHANSHKRNNCWAAKQTVIHRTQCWVAMRTLRVLSPSFWCLSAQAWWGESATNLRIRLSLPDGPFQYHYQLSSGQACNPCSSFFLFLFWGGGPGTKVTSSYELMWVMSFFLLYLGWRSNVTVPSTKATPFLIDVGSAFSYYLCNIFYAQISCSLFYPFAHARWGESVTYLLVHK